MEIVHRFIEQLQHLTETELLNIVILWPMITGLIVLTRMYFWLPLREINAIVWGFIWSWLLVMYGPQMWTVVWSFYDSLIVIR